MPVDLSIVVVHRNAEVYLQKCLRALSAAAAGVSYDVAVVDNASRFRDRLIQNFSPEFPEVRWIQNDQNLGFGRAVNQGVQAASAEIVVILNPDTELLPGALKALHSFFQERSGQNVGAVGGKLLFSDGSHQPSCGPFPGLTHLVMRLPLPPEKRRGYWPAPGADRDSAPIPVDWVTGAFLAIRRSVFERLGGFDKDFFLYYEDVDLCLRARQAGFQTWYLPAAAAYHHKPHAIRRPDPGLTRVIQSSRVLYFKKHRPAWETWALRQIQRLERVG